MPITHKKIIIDSQGPIYPKGGMYGPFLTPFKERIETVVALVIQKYNVYEILNDGTKVQLTLQNVNQDLNEKVKAPEAPKNEQQNNGGNKGGNKGNNKNPQSQPPKKEEVVDPSNKKVEDTVVSK